MRKLIIISAIVVVVASVGYFGVVRGEKAVETNQEPVVEQVEVVEPVQTPEVVEPAETPDKPIVHKAVSEPKVATSNEVVTPEVVKPSANIIHTVTSSKLLVTVSLDAGTYKISTLTILYGTDNRTFDNPNDVVSTPFEVGVGGQLLVTVVDEAGNSTSVTAQVIN